MEVENITPIEGGITIAELYKNKADYAGKEVKLHGKVVKFTSAVMGKNWVHLQDGSMYGDHVDITITTSDVVNVNDVATFEGVVIQAQADGPVTAGTNLSFYSSTTNETFTLNQSANADTAALIDLVFTHHSVFKTNDELAFQSPNSANLHQMWAEFPGFDPPYDYTTDDKNQTYFKSVDVTDWDSLDYDAIEDIVGDIGTEIEYYGIYVGDYIAFETQMGYKGIIKVTETIIEHNPYNESYITFDVKVQK